MTLICKLIDVSWWDPLRLQTILLLLLLLLQTGAPGAANGLVSELVGVKSGPLLQRSNIILGVAAVVCAPLVAIR